MHAFVEPAALRLSPNVVSTTPIELARMYVKTRVQIPALQSALPAQIKNKIRHSDLWIDRFQRVGDLLYYLRRFDVSHNDPMYVELKNHDLLTFEDIVHDFYKSFELWANDSSRIEDFVIGEQYSVYDILILARNYDTRAGGMFVLESNGKPTAVVIKATLSNGHYPNEWIKEGDELKYYLKSISGVFGTHFKPNAAIINNHQLPVVTFTRDSDASPFIFRGIFRYHDILEESDGAKAFILHRDSSLTPVMMNNKYSQAALEREIKRSALSTQNERLQRLAKAKKRPSTYVVKTKVYVRNPDVIAEVLFQAQGVCQRCKEKAPFIRNSTGEPYLEVHHRTPLAMGGDDSIENAIALCPNCHREQHFGPSQIKETFQKSSVSADLIAIDVIEDDLQEALNVNIS